MHLRHVCVLAILVLSFTFPLRAGAAVAELAVTFDVVNTNTSRVFCPSDGKAYQIRGHLVGPSALLGQARIPSATVYLHSIGMGEFFWHFPDDPSVDVVTQMAKLGHVSLVYDQLGYGASDRPPGYQSCYGSEADTAHQIVQALKAGTYTVEGVQNAPVFRRVALAGHFAGVFMTQAAAYSYGDADALVSVSFAEFPVYFSPTILSAFGAIVTTCALGGQPSDGDTGPGGYHFTPPSEATFRKLFFGAKPEVVDAAVALRHRGPCGEPMSALTNIASDTLLLRDVTVPVLLVYGDKDVVYLGPGAAGRQQAHMFSGSSDVTLRIIRNAGSALPLDNGALRFRAILTEWLKQRGF